MSTDAELEGILAFLRTAERLKSTPRSGWTTAGERESVAAHTWRLSLMAAVLSDRFPGSRSRPAAQDLPDPRPGRSAARRRARAAPDRGGEQGRTRARGPPGGAGAAARAAARRSSTELWDEYEAARTPEAQLAKGLDKLETILQHTQGLNPADFDYRFNLTYGQAYTAAHPLLAALRERLDQATEARARESDAT